MADSLADASHQEFLGGATGLEFDAVTDLFTEELLAQWRFRRYDHDFGPFVANLHSAGFRAQKVEGARAIEFEFHQGREINGRAVQKPPQFDGLVNSQGLFRLGGQPGLRTCKIGGFEPACIVFVFGLVLFVGGIRMHGTRSSGQRGQLPGEMFDDVSNDDAL